MASITVRACLRCHAKKIKCSGHPSCRNCVQSGVLCEPYTRPKRTENSEVLSQARRRVQWLENELHLQLGVDVREVPTGSPLRLAPNNAPGSASSQTFTSPAIPEDQVNLAGPISADHPSRGVAGGSPAVSNAPELSLLALNATGEMRYLGPSSGTFFAAYATAIAKSIGSGTNASGRRHGLPVATAALSYEHFTLSLEEARMLLQSYFMWVHPLYPLFNPDFLEDLVARCCRLQPTESSDRTQETEANGDMAIFYLVMALGATNYSNTTKETQFIPKPREGPKPSHLCLYSRALRCFDHDMGHIRTNVSTVQTVLLISIYSSYGPIGSSQWQLAGLAMRMAVEIGLHFAPPSWQTSEQELDRRNRVFWTAYAIEISLAYNLGRPPSISHEHITAALPAQAKDTLLGLYHIKHRQIQSRIVTRVYCGAKGPDNVIGPDNSQSVVSKLQAELDEWKAALSVLWQSAPSSSYPYSYWERLYHGTCFVLHRASPLCPQPSATSIEKCIRSAGAYVECMLEVLRISNVPMTWMLIQGVLFAGLTMLVTARTGLRLLVGGPGLSFLLVDLPCWTRKCSVCLAIMSERWNDELLSKLDTQFEALANDTLRIISTSVTAQPQIDTQDITPSLRTNLHVNSTAYPEASSITGGWDHLESFREFLGMEENMHTFWDMFPADDYGKPQTPFENEGHNGYIGASSGDGFSNW